MTEREPQRTRRKYWWPQVPREIQEQQRRDRERQRLGLRDGEDVDAATGCADDALPGSAADWDRAGRKLSDDT